jgi:hypothetical protein
MLSPSSDSTVAWSSLSSSTGGIGVGVAAGSEPVQAARMVISPITNNSLIHLFVINNSFGTFKFDLNIPHFGFPGNVFGKKMKFRVFHSGGQIKYNVFCKLKQKAIK